MRPLLILVLSLSMAGTGCFRMTKEKREAEMDRLLAEMKPIAEQLNKLKGDTEKNMANAMSGGVLGANGLPDPEKLKEYQSKHFATAGHQGQQKRRSLMTKLNPYQRQFAQHKYMYINDFGRVAYNNYIESKRLGWGLGTYW